jgi:hypothetical protein
VSNQFQFQLIVLQHPTGMPSQGSGVMWHAPHALAREGRLSCCAWYAHLAVTVFCPCPSINSFSSVSITGFLPSCAHRLRSSLLIRSCLSFGNSSVGLPRGLFVVWVHLPSRFNLTKLGSLSLQCASPYLQLSQSPRIRATTTNSFNEVQGRSRSANLVLSRFHG